MSIKRCMQCGKVGVKISARGLCWPCAIDNIDKAARNMQNKHGKYYERWKKSMKRFTDRLEVE